MPPTGSVDADSLAFSLSLSFKGTLHWIGAKGVAGGNSRRCSCEAHIRFQNYSFRNLSLLMNQIKSSKDLW